MNSCVYNTHTVSCACRPMVALICDSIRDYEGVHNEKSDANFEAEDLSEGSDMELEITGAVVRLREYGL